MNRLLYAILVLSWTSKLIAAPASNLSSPLQEIRDAAARFLRTTYTPPARNNWDTLVSRVKLGDSMTNVLELIRQYNPKAQPEMGAWGGRAGFEHYRLDDLWMLRCDFKYTYNTNPVEQTLFKRELVEP